MAIVTPAVKEGVLYANMNDMRQPSNSLSARVVDNISGNYNYKMGVVRIKKIGESPYKHPKLLPDGDVREKILRSVLQLHLRIPSIFWLSISVTATSGSHLVSVIAGSVHSLIVMQSRFPSRSALIICFPITC